jgi:hypothetical protein
MASHTTFTYSVSPKLSSTSTSSLLPLPLQRLPNFDSDHNSYALRAQPDAVPTNKHSLLVLPRSQGDLNALGRLSGITSMFLGDSAA